MRQFVSRLDVFFDKLSRFFRRTARNAFVAVPEIGYDSAVTRAGKGSQGDHGTHAGYEAHTWPAALGSLEPGGLVRAVARQGSCLA